LKAHNAVTVKMQV